MYDKFKVFVVSHTHWDREWYQTFQSFRKRLVYMIDDLIMHLENDPDYKYFHMDGQTIVLEDYLEIRPENAERLKALIKADRIIIGPWYVMPDEFLISGESLVRNLQKGFEISRAYGVEPMKNGYVTDIFGHNSQLPQILKGFGIDSATLFRGIGDFAKDSFNWVGADGSNVFTLKLDRDRSYSNFYFAIRWPFEDRTYVYEEVISRMRELIQYSGDLSINGNLLMMDGVDHLEIEPDIPKLLHFIKENMEEIIDIEQCRLEDYITLQKNSLTELDTIHGELYNPGKKGINNQLLKNVLSSMVHIKQMNNECETLLTRWAEPFEAAASFTSSRNTNGFLKEAWKLLMQNHPHDSICGCSITRVHEDNEYRYNQVKDIAEEIIMTSLDDIAESTDMTVFDKENICIVFNASQQKYEGVIEADLEFPEGSQGNFKIFDETGNVIPYQILNVVKGTCKKIIKFRKLLKLEMKDIYTVAFESSLPAIGFKSFGYEEYKTIMPEAGGYTYKEFHVPVKYSGTMRTGSKTWENKTLIVTFDGNNTLDVLFKVTGKKYCDLLIFEDCADIGDGWNYKKPLKDSRYLSTGCRTDFSIEHDGINLVQWKLTQYMNLPAEMSLNGIERSNTSNEFIIDTFITMKKGSSRLEFQTIINNNITEHRLRILFAGNIKTDTFFSSTPFFLQERSIRKPDCSDFAETDTGAYPNQGIVILRDDTDCLALSNKGLNEIEVTEDESHTLGLTLFRSFKNEVGRPIGEMSLMKRNMSFDYSLEFASASASNYDLILSGEAWRNGIKGLCCKAHGGLLSPSASFFGIDVPGAVLSSIRNINKMQVIRLYNSGMTDTQGFIQLYKAPVKASILNLNNEELNRIDFDKNNVFIKMKPAQILTIGLEY